MWKDKSILLLKKNILTITDHWNLNFSPEVNWFTEISNKLFLLQIIKWYFGHYLSTGRNKMLFKFLKFGVVGFTGLIIDFSITYLLKEKVRLHRYISSSIGFTIAASSNYLFNRIWTFESNYSRIFLEYSSFLIISIIGLAINNLFLYLFEKRMRFYFAKLVAIGVTTIWNFFANYFFTFNL